jgi:hypothetical protein
LCVGNVKDANVIFSVEVTNCADERLFLKRYCVVFGELEALADDRTLLLVSLISSTFNVVAHHKSEKSKVVNDLSCTPFRS